MCVIATRVHATDAPRALDQPHAYLRARERERKQSRVRDNAQLWRNEGDAKYSNQNKILFINKMLTADMFVLFVSLIVCAAAIVYMFHHRPPHMFAYLCVCVPIVQCQQRAAPHKIAWFNETVIGNRTAPETIKTNLRSFPYCRRCVRAKNTNHRNYNWEKMGIYEWPCGRTSRK